MPDPLRGGAPRGRGGLAYLIDAVRVRPGSRKLLTGLSVLLFLAGAGMFAYPLATDIYAGQILQESLDETFTSPEFRDAYINGTLAEDDPLTRLKIPALGVDALVVAGTSPAALRAGAGHYPTTALPGEAGNVAIAGHRTTYGKPFNRIDEVPEGSEIILETPLAVHTYRVVKAPAGVPETCANGACWITHPNDWSVADPTERPMLTLTTCHPKGSARQRLILRAELVNSVAHGAAG